MALLEDLNKINIIPPIKEVLDRGKFFINEEQKVDQVFHLNEEPNWIYAKFAFDRKCSMWLNVHFALYRFVPSPCFDCWKIVAKPRHLKDAFAILDLQKWMKLPSKVGMEKREYSGALGGFSAFWYAPLGCGLEKARKLYARVRKAVSEQIDPEVRVYLKRACTEMEQAAGPTDKWEWNKNLALVEDLVNSVFMDSPKPQIGAKFIEVDTKTRWIYWAAIHGDQTYLEYVDKPLDYIVRSVEYQDSIHNEKDFPQVARKETLSFVGNWRGEEKECDCKKEPLICKV